jgi:hypothetical protein
MNLQATLLSLRSAPFLMASTPTTSSRAETG